MREVASNKTTNQTTIKPKRKPHKFDLKHLYKKMNMTKKLMKKRLLNPEEVNKLRERLVQLREVPIKILPEREVFQPLISEIL